MDMKKQSFYLSQTQIDRLKEISIKKSLTPSVLIRIAINNFIDKEDRKNA